MNKFFIAGILTTLLASTGCAGRDAHPVTTSQAQDQNTTCADMLAEMQANDRQISKLGNEKGLKVAQNVAAGALGFFTLGIGWAAMDFKGAAWEEQEALQQRNQYLSGVYQSRCIDNTYLVK